MRPLISANSDVYKQDGYLKFDGFFTAKEISDIKRAYSECIESALEGVKIIHEDDGITIRSIMGYHQQHPILDRYTRDPRVLEVINGIIQSPVYVSQSKINSKAPKNNNNVVGKKWLYHRDFSFWHILDGIPKPSMVSTFVYITEQTEENGAIYVLKGSHKDAPLDLIKSEVGFEKNGTGERIDDTSEKLSLQIISKMLMKHIHKYECVTLIGRPGDLIIMDPRLLHASNDNNTNLSRDIMITVYNPTNNLPEHTRQELFLCDPDHRAIKPWTA